MSKAVILMYHNIDTPPQGVRIPNLYVTPRMFRFQMWYLKKAGFKVLSLSDMLASVGAGNVSGNLAAITFDDGYRDFYKNAYPILTRCGYPSTIYVVSDLVGKINTWDSENENITKPLMDWDMIREISKSGVEIGSHTRSHPQLSTLSGEALQEELKGSKKTLEEQLDKNVEHFCYPYGDLDELVKVEVKKAGYRSAVTTRRGHVLHKFDAFSLPRIPIKLVTNPVSFLYKIHTDSEKRKGRQK
ncbi:MAG TPA: polysaccharide deacetylase family protein [Nitrospirota bacterium]|nr:polysaccharide deacetylase family protein [Nitrospirota bacterium]